MLRLLEVVVVDVSCLAHFARPTAQLSCEEGFPKLPMLFVTVSPAGSGEYALSLQC